MNARQGKKSLLSALIIAGSFVQSCCPQAGKQQGRALHNKRGRRGEPHRVIVSSEREAPLGAGQLDTFFPHGIPSAALTGSPLGVHHFRFQISDCRFQIVILIPRNKRSISHAEAAEKIKTKSSIYFLSALQTCNILFF